MQQSNWLKADFHIHSRFSPDSSNSLEQIIQRCQETGISCIAIADHGTTEGAFKLQCMAPPIKVIVAEEILTTEGEIMGLFLKETIPSGSSAEETIARIKAQGGLVNVPHPFDIFRSSALNNKKLFEIAGQMDMVEVFNARYLLPQTSHRAIEFAMKHNLPQCAGSDAHSHYEIGRTYVEMPDFQGKDDFLAALKQGKINGHKANPLVHVNSVITRIKPNFKKQ